VEACSGETVVGADGSEAEDEGEVEGETEGDVAEEVVAGLDVAAVAVDVELSGTGDVAVEEDGDPCAAAVEEGSCGGAGCCASATPCAANTPPTPSSPLTKSRRIRRFNDISPPR
jgi:hypothetical protein